MTLSAAAIAELSDGRVVGDAGASVSGIATPDTATPSDLLFVEDARFLDAAARSSAGILLAGRFAEGASFGGALVICDQPRLAFARAARQLSATPGMPAGIHPSAVVHPSAAIGADVSIGPFASVDEGAVLEDRVQLGPAVHIGRGVHVGEDSVLRSHVVVYPGTTIGARVIAHAGTVLGSDGFGYVRDAGTGRYEGFPQVGRLVVEDEVELGTLCTVDRGALGDTVIGRGTKLDNQVHVAHNVRIGRDVVIAAQTGIAGSSVIEDGAVIAGQVGIADHVRIGGGAILGAQCGVPTGKEIRGPGVLFWGTPARPIKQYLKELATLARLAKKKG
ncbi:MAG TPA: UDP-3-O-(3-hydroxymyristoyl)glucosamine N-acyltransferase [Vicinamibacterales bacterium]|nr:UDP-3-O-(3-hydroxymyristoyl)glucosamine N-acyltransferase [Vicinamibacterales bacterium]